MNMLRFERAYMRSSFWVNTNTPGTCPETADQQTCSGSGAIFHPSAGSELVARPHMAIQDLEQEDLVAKAL